MGEGTGLGWLGQSSVDDRRGHSTRRGI